MSSNSFERFYWGVSLTTIILLYIIRYSMVTILLPHYCHILHYIHMTININHTSVILHVMLRSHIIHSFHTKVTCYSKHIYINHIDTWYTGYHLANILLFYGQYTTAMYHYLATKLLHSAQYTKLDQILNDWYNYDLKVI